MDFSPPNGYRGNEEIPPFPSSEAFRDTTTTTLVEFEICTVKVIERDHFSITIASHR